MRNSERLPACFVIVAGVSLATTPALANMAVSKSHIVAMQGARKNAQSPYLNCFGAACVPQARSATFLISNGTTKNVSCSGGVCEATRQNAVLNVGDLENLLADGNVEVTTGTKGSGVADLQILKDLSWTSAATLTLSVNGYIYVSRPVSIAGSGNLILDDNTAGNGGDVIIAPKTSITFATTASQLQINGTNYKLENKIVNLANDINANPSGAFALSQSISGGKWFTTPIQATFTGTFEGLGNVIKKFVLNDNTDVWIAFFLSTDSGGVIRDVGLDGGSITNNNTQGGTEVGSLVAVLDDNAGSSTIYNCWSSATVNDQNGPIGEVGGLAGTVGPGGAIIASFETGAVTGPYSANGATGSATGGLVGDNFGQISYSHETGSISVPNAGPGYSNMGGLTGYGNGSNVLITFSYSTGAVTYENQTSQGGFEGGFTSYFDGQTLDHDYSTGSVTMANSVTLLDFLGEGGFTGVPSPNITNSYSSGLVTESNSSGYFGGFIGDGGAPCCSNDAWDTDPGGVQQNWGTSGSDSGVTGVTPLTDKIMRCKKMPCTLPPGFDSNWGMDPSINNGYPYLLANPPM